MKILCLYNNVCAVELFEWIRDQGHKTVLCTGKISGEWCRMESFDLTVSYTYRYILSGEVLCALGNNAVNLHNSYLPWNRGADPNIWSIVEDSPRGVTLHFMDAGLDTGTIIAQELSALEADDTLKSSYDRLDKAAKELFKTAFSYYPFWKEMGKRAAGSGTYHSVQDGEGIRGLIGSYDVSVHQFRKSARNLLGK